jgi:tetratricopeptide (TPR) repeat protein
MLGGATVEDAHEQELMYDTAVADFTEAIRLDPKDACAYNARAWIWATCPGARYRDGPRAIKSATRACELLGWKVANHIGTLAAACAEAGDFDAAVKWETKASELYADAEDKAKGQERLQLYQEKKPYRETNPSPMGIPVGRREGESLPVAIRPGLASPPSPPPGLWAGGPRPPGVAPRHRSGATAADRPGRPPTGFAAVRPR